MVAIGSGWSVIEVSQDSSAVSQCSASRWINTCPGTGNRCGVVNASNDDALRPSTDSIEPVQHPDHPSRSASMFEYWDAPPTGHPLIPLGQK
ncbi:Uncharacterised protein [Mycobacterium tuberculosis]|nr:Uncharacterised protein [Mycobacterium tuberculosis]